MGVKYEIDSYDKSSGTSKILLVDCRLLSLSRSAYTVTRYGKFYADVVSTQ